VNPAIHIPVENMQVSAADSAIGHFDLRLAEGGFDGRLRAGPHGCVPYVKRTLHAPHLGKAVNANK
jgi:hypothetical protein